LVACAAGDLDVVDADLGVQPVPDALEAFGSSKARLD
jgi:hypothetical protein